MYQITEYYFKTKKINTEYGIIEYLEWLEKEKIRIGGWSFIQENNEGKVALFYNKDRRGVKNEDNRVAS